MIIPLNPAADISPRITDFESTVYTRVNEHFEPIIKQYLARRGGL
jgi:hypothetical protein